MRVVHIITRMIVGGAQENTLFNCMDLAELYGDEVTLVTGPSLGAEGALLNLNNIGKLRVIEVPSLRRSIHPWRDAVALRQLKRIIREQEPEVVHTHSAKGGMLGRTAAWQCRVPCVVHTVHGAPFHPYQRRASRWLFQQCERWAAHRCHHMISVADAMTDLMVHAKIAPREKFTTIYSGMEVEPLLQADQYRTQMRVKYGFTDSNIVFGKIARLFNLKGHEYLIEAARSVCANVPEARFLLVGNGILREQFERMIADYGLSDRFVFAGLVPPSDIPKHIAAMDALVHTSLREGLARALPQAMIAGKPAISFDIDGAREVVIDGETGFLIPPKSVRELSIAIERLATDGRLREQYGQTGRERFTDQFRHETMTSRIRELYQSILDRGTGVSPVGSWAGRN
jgi:glycosyltransferase involved in cell wall biosynthesis